MRNDQPYNYEDDPDAQADFIFQESMIDAVIYGADPMHYFVVTTIDKGDPDVDGVYLVVLHEMIDKPVEGVVLV